MVKAITQQQGEHKLAISNSCFESSYNARSFDKQYTLAICNTEHELYDYNSVSLFEKFNINARTNNANEIKYAIKDVEYRPNLSNDQSLNPENTSKLKKNELAYNNAPTCRDQIKNIRADIQHQKDQLQFGGLPQHSFKGKLRMIKHLATKPVKSIFFLLEMLYSVLSKIPLYWFVYLFGKCVNGADEPLPPSKMDFSDSVEHLSNHEQDEETNENEILSNTAHSATPSWVNSESMPNSIQENANYSAYDINVHFAYILMYWYCCIFLFICFLKHLETDQNVTRITDQNVTRITNNQNGISQCRTEDSPQVHTSWKRPSNKAGRRRIQPQPPRNLPTTKLSTDLHSLTQITESYDGELTDTLIQVIYPEHKHEDPKYVKEVLVPSHWTLKRVIDTKVHNVGKAMVLGNNHYSENLVVSVARSYDHSSKRFLKQNTVSLSEEQLNQRIGNRMLQFIISLPELPLRVDFFRKGKK